MKKIKNLLFLGALLLILAPFKAKAIEANPLTHLEVETTQGTGNFDLSGGQKSFSFALATPYSYANIIAKSSNETYVITGAGHVECKEGLNTINVVVTDPADNSSVTYTINLNFKAKDKVAVVNSTTQQESTDTNQAAGEENPSTGSFLNYSTICVAMAGGILILKGTKKSKRLY